MRRSRSHTTLNIPPEVNVYATYRRLRYPPWFAIAEFVDNSTQTSYDHRRNLLRAFSKDETPGRLRIEISYDSEENTLTVVDNANVFDAAEAERQLAWFRSTDAPHFRVPEPPGVSDTRCRVDLSTAPCLQQCDVEAWLDNWSEASPEPTTGHAHR